MKILPVDRIAAVNVIANRNRALLTVHHLKSLVVANNPIHHVQRKIFLHRANDFRALFCVVDEVALIFRANVELAAVADDAVLAEIFVAVEDLAHRDFVQFNFHALASESKAGRTFFCR